MPLSTASRSTPLRPPALPTIHADPARLQRLTVCTRPFRAAGPRIEAEHLAGKLLVHNYGHGGSGWSLSWGSAGRVLAIVREVQTSVRTSALTSAPTSAQAQGIAVIGCGAMGLTTALTLQRAGFTAKIYARDLPPAVRSARATGLWSPDSRVGLAREIDAPGSTLAADWEDMARRSWSAYAELLAERDAAIDLHDRYLLSDLPPAEAIAQRESDDRLGFAHLDGRLADLYTQEDLGPGTHPFTTPWARRVRTLRFNISAYTERLLTEFRARGGTLEQREFHSPAEIATLPEERIVHCTGYSARDLFGDRTLTPVRGQIGWLPAQRELGYSLQWERLSVVPRGDGIAVQIGASSDDTGWNLADETSDPAESETAVQLLARLQR